MNATIIVRYQTNENSSCNVTEMHDMLKHTYGGALNKVADSTFLIDTYDTPEDVFKLLAPFFTFDDKLFVANVSDCRSMHHIPKTKPSVRRIAV